MRKTVASVVLLGLSVFLAVTGLNYFREVSILSQSRLDLSRFSVSLVSQHEHSMRLGAESRSIFEFKLPASYSGLSRCGKDGYSEAMEIERILLRLPLDAESKTGCSYVFTSKNGTHYRYTLTGDRLIVVITA